MFGSDLVIPQTETQISAHSREWEAMILTPLGEHRVPAGGCWGGVGVMKCCVNNDCIAFR